MATWRSPSADTFTDTALIDGDVALGARTRSTWARAEVTGAITASRGDLLDFSGNFGHETIDNFAAGIGRPTTRSRSPWRLRQLRCALALNVAGRVRRRDLARRGGSITLIGVRASSLVSADFKWRSCVPARSRGDDSLPPAAVWAQASARRPLAVPAVRAFCTWRLRPLLAVPARTGAGHER